MTQSFVEILLLIPAALCTGFVVFVAGVIQGIMDDTDEANFKHLLGQLTKHAMHSPYAIGISSVTFLGMIPYFILYGMSNMWFTAGLFLWIITSIVSKLTVLPIYKAVAALESSNATQLGIERKKLHNMNILRASLSVASIIVMVIAFF